MKTCTSASKRVDPGVGGILHSMCSACSFDVLPFLCHMIPSFGVTTEPDVREVPISSSDDFIILGSDGVWDMINEFDVIALIDKAQAETATSERKDEAQEATAVVNVRAASDALPSWDAAAVAYDLCRMARKRWREKANRIDDITAIAVNLRRVMARTMSANISAGTSPPARRRAPSHDKVKSTSHRARGVSSMR